MKLEQPSMQEVSTLPPTVTRNAQGEDLSATLRAYHQSKLQATRKDRTSLSDSPPRNIAPEFSMEQLSFSSLNFVPSLSFGGYGNKRTTGHTSNSNSSSTTASDDPYHHIFLSPTPSQPSNLPSFQPFPLNEVSISPEADFARIDRSYFNPDVISFSPEYPLFLSSRVSQVQFQTIISELNLCYKGSHANSRRDLFDAILDSLTCYTYRFCCGGSFPSPSEKAIDKASLAIAEFNTNIFNPAGLTMVDPIENAFLHVSVNLL
ncbi:hypothetical protein DSO57_1014105 [Entomophthora muscae]|uniref:Uncharacterized protein n=1 Tax=Entomophthora muscae TaxID=34485 RepID=A0ACC2URB2_9FUNG|nr:hypothetical protein DSO57_1014105 [Entomophthora muscae]